MKKCEKCGYESEENKPVKGKYLCRVCRKFIPENNQDFEKYIQEKIDWKLLETFRNSENKNIKRMKEKAELGRIMNRAPFGYKIENKQLIPDNQNKLIVQEIFRTFSEQNISLNQLAKQFNFSVNGIKKILKNFTYIGKVKFRGQIIQGKHEPIITPELFNRVQNKLENKN